MSGSLVMGALEAAGTRLAGRSALAALGPVGAGIGAAWLLYDAYQLYNVYNESHEETKDAPPEEVCGDCRKEAEKEANDTHDKIEQYEGKDYDEVERELDQKLKDNGWDKQPLDRGDGSRYTSPDLKRQIRINRGYPNANQRGVPDSIHSGPYIKRSSTGTRVPLRGNPFLGVK